MSKAESVSKTIKNASLFTAILTGAEALPIGLLALKEDWVVEWLQRITGKDSWGGIWFTGDRTDCNALRSSDDSAVLVYENDGMDNVWLR